MKVKLSYPLAGHQVQEYWCNPVLKDGKIKQSKENELFKTEFTGSLLFIGEDYDIIKSLPLYCTKIDIYIYLDCSALPIFTGYFTRYMGKYDDDKSTFEITPKPFDSFNRYDEVKDKEQEVYKTTLDYRKKAIAGKGVYTEEKRFIFTDTEKHLITGAFSTNYDVFITGSYNHPNKYPFFTQEVCSQIISLISTQQQFTSENESSTNWYVRDFKGRYFRSNSELWLDNFEITLFRQVMWTIKNDDGTDVEVDSTGLWEKESDTTIGGIDATKWTRKFPYQYTTVQEMIDGLFYTSIGEDYNGTPQNWTLIVKSNQPTDYYVKYNYGRDLIATINQLLLPAGLTFKSRLLQDQYSPLTGEKNHYNNLLLFKKSDVLRPDVDEGKKWKLKVGDILEDLKILFNADFEIVGKNLIFEHLNYFSCGRSYSTAKSLGLDLTEQYPDYLEETNKYEYVNDNMPRVERFSFSEGVSIDFLTQQIEYPVNCFSKDKKERKTTLLITDLPMCQNLENSNIEGFVLMACDSTPDGDDCYPVYSGGSKYLGEGVANIYLSWTYLIEEFYFYNRLYSSGVWLENNVSFNTYQKLCIQKEITFPLCCGKIDPYKLVRTNLGDGEINTIEFDLKTQQATIQLLYDYQ